MSLLWAEANAMGRIGIAMEVAPRKVRDYVDSWPEAVHATQAGFASHVESPIFKHFQHTQYQDVHGPGQAFASPATKVEDVDLTQPIHATQRLVFRKHVSDYLGDQNKETARVERHTEQGHRGPSYEGDVHPTFVRWQGKMHATDGHHRISAEIMRGTKSMKGYVYDADKHGFTDRNMEYPHHEPMPDWDWGHEKDFDASKWGVPAHTIFSAPHGNEGKWSEPKHDPGYASSHALSPDDDCKHCQGFGTHVNGEECKHCKGTGWNADKYDLSEW